MTTPSWDEGDVFMHDEHIVLTYTDDSKDATVPPIARLAPQSPGARDRFIVQFLAVPGWEQSRIERAREATRQSLDFFLVKLVNPDPWAYAIYHCDTHSNVYSDVHWSYFPLTRLCPMPDLRFTYEGESDTSSLVYGESEGTFWAWAWPELLGWSGEITWLYSPVTGNSVWPGDLWGVDHRGELLLVETKRVQKGGARQDPYQDFVAFEENKAYPTLAAINERWKRLYQSELRFAHSRGADLQVGNRIMERWPGVVDHSRQRLIVWRWRELYLSRVVPQFLSGEYVQAVERNLGVRAHRGSPPPHYFALFTMFDTTYPRLSAKGIANYERLVAAAGLERVHARAVTAQPVDGDRACIRSLPGSMFMKLP